MCVLLYKGYVCTGVVPNLFIIVLLCGRLSDNRFIDFAIYIYYFTSHISSSFSNNDKLLEFRSHFYLNILHSINKWTFVFQN